MEMVFERFLQNADKISETWQIVEFFENELQKFKNEISDYENNIAKEQESLKDLRSEYLSVQDELKKAKDELEQTRTQITNRLEADLSNVPMDKTIQVAPLQKVDIRLKDGIVVKANPAVDVYSKEIAEKYLMSLKEIRFLRAKLAEFEARN